MSLDKSFNIAWLAVSDENRVHPQIVEFKKTRGKLVDVLTAPHATEVPKENQQSGSLNPIIPKADIRAIRLQNLHISKDRRRRLSNNGSWHGSDSRPTGDVGASGFLRATRGGKEGKRGERGKKMTALISQYSCLT
ncbi:MAG: hypothetical protein ACE1ZE_08300, partial [Candidatus Binatia bacterium]